MKLISIFIVGLLCSLPVFSQEVIQLPFENSSDVQWKTEERQYYSAIWQTEVITNVAKPTLLAFRPDPQISNGTSVIIAPGGALYAHSIVSEGRQVAQWLVEKGITAFVLKYRLVPTGKDGVKEATDDWEGIGARATPVLPLAINDGLEAVNYVRSNAKDLDLDPNKIGFMGFSAGGTVTMGVTYSYDKATRPDFIVPVYAWTDVLNPQEAPTDAPPMLVICASDDPLGLATSSVQLYSQWLTHGKSVGLHMYSRGGHGFGMRDQQLPSDSWIERFYDWAVVEGFVTQPKPE
jgi:acetyl esterase/lipase